MPNAFKIEHCTADNCAECTCTGCGTADAFHLTVWKDDKLCDACLDHTFTTLERAADKIKPSWAS